MERPPPLDPAQHIVLRGVAALDEFVFSRGGVERPIDSGFLKDVCDNANRQEQETGDLCPVVLGHLNLTAWTPEVDQPPVVGFCRNWRVEPLFDTGRMAAVCDIWAVKTLYHEYDQFVGYPSRSAELWFDTREIRPLSLLAGTTPHRYLGPLPAPTTLSRLTGEHAAICRDLGPLPCALARETPMPTEEKKPDVKPPTEDAKTPKDADMMSVLNQIVAGMSKISETLATMTGAAPTPKDDANKDGKPGDEDAELEALMNQLGQGGDEHGTGPIAQNMAYAGNQNTEVTKLQKQVLDLQNRDILRDVSDKVEQLRRDGYQMEDADAETWKQELLLMPAEVRVTQLARAAKSPRPPVGTGAIGAVRDAVAKGSVPGPTRPCTVEEAEQVYQFQKANPGTAVEIAHHKVFGTYPYGYQMKR